MSFKNNLLRTLFLRFLSFLLAALLSVPANAAGVADLTEMSLESLMDVTVSGASRYKQKSSEAPTYASVVTAEDIRRNGYRTLSDLLRTVPGVLVTNDRNYSYVGIRGFQPPGDDTYLPDVNKDSGDGLTWDAELKAVTKVGERHRLTAGTAFGYDLRKDQMNYDVGAPAPNLDSRQSSKSWAAYLQDEFRIHPKLILNAGVRYDHYSPFGGTTSPRLGLIWMPREKTAAKLLYGRAFRTPNAYEMYFTELGVETKANPNLEPESVNSFEAVLEQHAEAFGGIEGRASYAWQRSEYQETGEVPPNSPEHMAKLNLVFSLLPGKLLLSPELQYIGSRKTLPDKAVESVGGYTLANATLLAHKLPWGREISASVYNIFDKDYADPAGSEHLQSSIPQDGRNYRVKPTCRL